MMQQSPVFDPALAAPRHWPTWIGIALLRLAVMLPYPWLMRLGRWTGRLMLRFGAERRRIAETNLRACFPEWDEGRCRAVLKSHFEALGMGLFEMPLAWWGAGVRLRPLAHVQGLEHLERALARGKGAILLSAHFTSIEIGGRLLALHAPFHPMYRSHDNPVIERILARNRARRCEKAIPRDNVREMVRSLKGNNAVWFAPDQNTQRKVAVFVKFFGHSASTSPGTARLAKMTGAAVVPFHTVRRADGAGYDLILEPALEGFPAGDVEADTQRVNDVIEGWVRQHPDQYLWIHRRFRTRPQRDDPPFYE